jgi:hypothetical protein
MLAIVRQAAGLPADGTEHDMTNPPNTTAPNTMARNRKRRIAYGATALASLCAVATMAMPSAAHAQDTGGDLGPRLERACLRIPNLQIRTDNLIERLNGDASVRGSLAWLQARVDKAEAEGREQLVTVLENRLVVRTKTLEVLEQRQAKLPELKQKCIDHGVAL